MSATSTDSETEFRIGSALSRAIKVYAAAFDKFILLTLILTAPALIVELIIGPPPQNRWGFWELVLWMLLWSLATATCLFGAYRVMQGQGFGVGDSVRAGLHRLGPVVGTTFLGTAGVLLAALLLVVPGIILECSIYVALPACVIERRGPTDSLRRSQVLTRGHRWPIFGLLALVTVLTVFVTVGAAVSGAILVSYLGVAGGKTAAWMLGAIFAFAVRVVMGSFGAVLVAVVYHDLRVLKEGADIDSIASAFN